MTDLVEVQNAAGVVRIMLNRPEKRNALSRALLGAFEKVLPEIANDTSARVVVLGGRGPAFCAGHDLSEMTGRTEHDYRDLFSACTRVMMGLRRLPQPVIARVHGVATAAGCQLVASCDLAVASIEATFATPGVKIGLFCTTPMVPLVRAIPDKPALEMLFTGASVSAERARELGLVNRVVPSHELDSAIDELTSAILAQSAGVLARGKRAFYQTRHLDEADAYERAVERITEDALAGDAQEGIAAFLQKRAPRWGGPV